MPHNLVEFIRAGLAVKRFHTVPTIKEDTVGMHSAGVALFCALLTDYKCSAELLMAALTHDLAEQIYGDIPSPAKHQLGIWGSMNAMEDKALEEAGLLQVLNVYEKRWLKLADCLDGMYFCISEKCLGNGGLDEIYGRYAAYIKELAPFSTTEQAVINEVHELWSIKDERK